MPNGINLMPGPSSAPASGNQLERSNPMNSISLQSHLQQSSVSQSMGQSQTGQPTPAMSDKDKDGGEGSEAKRQLTAIFRPDDAGEWKERLRLSHEAEQLKVQAAATTGASSWERRREDDDEVPIRDEEPEVEEEEGTVVGEGEGAKLWKAKRTLRKSVS